MSDQLKLPYVREIPDEPAAEQIARLGVTLPLTDVEIVDELFP